MDEVFAPLAYDGAPLLRVPVRVSRALLVKSGLGLAFLVWNRSLPNSSWPCCGSSLNLH